MILNPFLDTRISFPTDEVYMPGIFLLMRFAGPETTTGVSKNRIHMHVVSRPIIKPGNSFIFFVKSQELLTGRKPPVTIPGKFLFINFMDIAMGNLPIGPFFLQPCAY